MSALRAALSLRHDRMHIIAMKKSIVDGHPWAPRNLLNAFQESKRRSIEQLLDPAVSRYPVPGLTTYARKMRDRFGDLYPYGIEGNRPTWEQMALYTYQQGIVWREQTEILFGFAA
jgi:4,5-dihydroxyphthalate decarboxylase